ncbi:hypothetical protein EGW08_007194, partial [Elysia chlorotica]
MTEQYSYRLQAFFLVAVTCMALVILVGYYDPPTVTLQSPQFRPVHKDFLPEIQQVVFVKVHKAASSTVQNILLRFALARNLSVLLPKIGTVINECGKTLEPSLLVQRPDGKDKYDILCNHVVYDETEISKFLPDNAIRVAILREPMAQALSALVYYSTVYPKEQLRRGAQKYPADPINGFLRHPQDFYPPTDNPLHSYINNRMSIDLGFDTHEFDDAKNNETKIDNFIKQLDKQIDFFLISEYFDESLLLLRRYLRWSMKDIIYLKSNSAKPLPPSSPLMRKPNITPEVEETFRKWDRIDYELYEYFLAKFLNTVKLEPHFTEELEAFKVIESQVVYFCLHDTQNS